MKYDVCVIGAGPCGNNAALELAKKGKKVCLVEKSLTQIGGTCLNQGCIPVKSLLEAAEVCELIKSSQNFGLEAEIKPIDLAKIKSITESQIQRLRKGLEFLFTKSKIDLKIGTASFKNANTITISNSDQQIEIQADQFILATGSKPKEIPGISTNSKNVLYSAGLLKSHILPKSLAIVGAGFIGTEFASMYQKWGVQVYLIEFLPQILNSEDPEIVRVLQRELTKKGVKIFTEHKLIALKDLDHNLTELELENLTDGRKTNLEVEQVLIAGGRKPNFSQLNLAQIGVALENGFVKVDQNLKTNLPHIYAGGDLINTPMLAHAAAREGLVIAAAILGQANYRLTNNIPNVVYTDPQIASIGLNEKKALETNLEIEVHKTFFKANAKAIIHQKEAGLIKIISQKSTNKILGASIVGPLATEIIQELVLAVELGLTLTDLKKAVHGHPTLVEIIGDSLE
ncbi:MAG: dihydrolipoyl dehydrogenase [Candidatus Margulisiibacteriota bacterium]|jgi:dihydrolipoamide dehydrogenase